MAVQIFRPFHIFMDQPRKPGFQFLPGLILLQAADFLRFQIAVGNLDGNGIHVFMVTAVHIAIAEGLGQMDRKRLLHPDEYPCKRISDLIDRDAGDRLNHTVRPALHQNLIFFLLHSVLHRDFRMIIRALTFLDFPVHAAARLHGILLCCGGSSIINIPAPHDKLYQITHGNTDDTRSRP